MGCVAASMYLPGCGSIAEGDLVGPVAICALSSVLEILKVCCFWSFGRRVLGKVDEQCLLSQGCIQPCAWCCCLLAP